MGHRTGVPDFVIFLATLLLLAIGIIMVFSSSIVTSAQLFGDPYYFLKRQLLWAALGLSGLFFAQQFDYHELRRLAVPFLLLALFLLILVLLIGFEAKGSSRWLGVGTLSFQPSEIIKLAIVIFLAYSLAEVKRGLTSFWRDLVPYLLLLALVCALILAQPDLGTAAAIAGTAYLMLAVAGAKREHLLLLLGLGLVAVAAAIVIAPYRMSRFMAFLDPWADPSETGYQYIQSLLAVGSGGLFGAGLGQGKQKLFYVPERHTDFIFAILSEELGFVGAAIILLLFFVLIWRGFRVALKAPDSFGSLLAAGITIMVILQALVNMGVVTGLLPITGITLPLVSYGGSSLLFSMLAIGILLNVSRYVKG